MYVTLPAVLSLVSSVTTFLAVTCLGLVLPEVTLFSALLGLTVDTCRLWCFFRARVSGSHLFGIGLA